MTIGFFLERKKNKFLQKKLESRFVVVVYLFDISWLLHII